MHFVVPPQKQAHICCTRTSRDDFNMAIRWQSKQRTGWNPTLLFHRLCQLRKSNLFANGPTVDWPESFPNLPERVT